MYCILSPVGCRRFPLNFLVTSWLVMNPFSFAPARSFMDFSFGFRLNRENSWEFEASKTSYTEYSRLYLLVKEWRLLYEAFCTDFLRLKLFWAISFRWDWFCLGIDKEFFTDSKDGDRFFPKPRGVIRWLTLWILRLNEGRGLVKAASFGRLMVTNFLLLLAPSWAVSSPTSSI